MRIISRVGIGKNPTSHHLDVTGSANFDSQVFIQNNVFLNANVDLGNTPSDLIAFNGRCTTSIEPNSTLSVNFGSSSLFWNNTYSKNLIIKNAGSIESDGNILNLGTISATTINIGRTGTNVNIYGSVNKIQSTDTEIFDKLITLNKNGLVDSASNSGFEIEENALTTAYIKTSSNRNEWLIKAPNKSGIISLEAGSAAFTHKIVSQASADRVWTIPDNTDTFVGTTNTQIVENKTLNNTTANGTFTANGGSSVVTNGTLTTNGSVTINGSITINGTAIGVGFVPIGAVVATIPALTGAYSCTATTTADSFGYVRCNGQVIADITSPLNGRTIPNINNDVFLKGNITSNATGGSNTHQHTTPNHSHSTPSHYHIWGDSWSNDGSQWGHYPYGDGAGNTYQDGYGYGASTGDAGYHSHHTENVASTGFPDGSGDRTYNYYYIRGERDGPSSREFGIDGAGNHWHHVNWHRHWIQPRATGGGGSVDGRNAMTTTNSAPTTNSASTEPKFITALYVMRVK